MKKMVLITTLITLPCLTYAMQPLDDASLAQQTGQDGLTVGISASTIEFDQLSIIDTDGIVGSATHDKAAALVVASTSSANPVKIQFLDKNNAALANTITAVLDTDGGANTSGADAFLNARIGFDSNLSKIKISPFSIYLAKPSGTVGTIGATGNIFDTTPANGLRADVTRLLSFGSGAEVNFTDGNPLAMNVQLGNAPQGVMLLLTGNIQTINIPNIELFSKSTDTTQNSSLNINGLQFKASTAAGFSLASFYAGVESNGLVMGHFGKTDKFDLTVGSIIAGTDGAQSTNDFDNLKNGSMGGFGLIGASVTNLKVNVKGM